MPAYDFRCQDCQVVFEVTRSIGDTDPVACPACGGDTKRVFSPVGVVFKGSGFHNTDYRKKPADTSPQKSDGAAESCPAAKSDSSACASCPSAKAED